MNDRYLFRAKRIDNGEWIIGDLSHHKTGKVFVKPLNGSAISTCEVDKDTICQCTGLKDKSGKLIWENDVVKHDFGKDQIGVQLAIVKYDSKYACYQIKPIYDWMYCDKSDCEVIGNIFDNPELIHE